MNNTPIPASEITELTVGLNRLARNLWWTWSHEAQEIFNELSPRAWQNLYHNAVAILHEVSDYELRSRLQDREFARRVREVLQHFQGYLHEKNTWAHKHAPGLITEPVAYFSAEFGFHESLPIAAGGLGVLAGDHTKSASDLGLGLVGISLFYREGYFQQAINPENWQTEYYSLLDPKNLPVERVFDARGEPMVGQVEIGHAQLHFQVWKVNVGRCTVFLLDSNRPENEPQFKDLTLRVYGGDSTTRIMQEILLGIGGVRVLRSLGIQPSVFHMNEGHSAFLTLELIREQLGAGKSFDDALSWTRQHCLFTTHTPVEAGHDRFDENLIEYTLGRFLKQMRVPANKLLALGRVFPANTKESEPFCMTVLALKTSRAANGVSELHGQVSRRMWQPLFPDKKEDDVPIGHITNGIHILGWMKGPMRQFMKRKLGSQWENLAQTQECWEKMADPGFVSDEELWALRYNLRRELIEFARRRLLMQGRRMDRSDFIVYDRLLNPDTLTIGFARRFATYKRAPLVFSRMEEVIRMAKDPQRPIQFVFAGKAHPRDDEGKRFIQYIIHLSKHSELQGHLVFLENYDVHVARHMISGSDIWLNNPRRPLEASGTSGQKIGMYGGLNLSIMDGWWREGYDGTNGFAIGDDSHPTSVAEQDRRDSDNLYRVLSEEVIPCFYERDATGIPRRWIAMMRRAMVTLVPKYNTHRMVQEYAQNYYLRG
ncbi:MAG TPA: alpha-glucan family phosphorylase [Candidatus Paceibacterota bacterium]|nr:alpha-glucan family phosphorylase [Verrucomicrobiota bacterium]HRY47203.1 alpha-glucan family phosphorylase [Candidatus Paceibacterota bacterium]